MANHLEPASQVDLDACNPKSASAGMSVAVAGKRAARVGGLAVAAYVITAVAAGHGVAGADTTNTPNAGNTGSGTSHTERGSEGDNDAHPSARKRSDTTRPRETKPSTAPSRSSDGDASSSSDDSSAADTDLEGAARADTDGEETESAVGGEHAEPAGLPSDDPVQGPTSALGEQVPEESVSEPETAQVAVVDDSAESRSDAAAVADSAPASIPPAPLKDAANWAVLGWVRRTFFNRPPEVHYDASLNSQDMTDGVITGNVGAVDPDGDGLTYTLVGGPKSGTVVIDELGNFTFTPTPFFVRSGGTDAFSVRVSDNRFHLLSRLFSPDHGTPTARIGVTVVPIPATASLPPLETFEVEKVIEFDLPDGVTVTGADLSPDGEHLILEVKVDDSTHIAVTNLDGGDYQCLSCGLVPNATKARALYDNQRIWFANTSGQQSADDPLAGAGAITYGVLECEGSIYACSNPTIKKVQFPSDRGLLRWLPVQNREAKPDPYGEYVTWTENTVFTGPRMSIGTLVATRNGYKITNQRIFSPQWYEKTDYATDFADATRFYEGASWHAGGRYLKYQTTTTGLNYDIWLLDTATGERRQLTTDLDYNESGDISPDGNWAYFSSARGLDRMDVFTALVRPSLIDSAAFPQIGRVSLWNNRRSMNEPWLMDLDTGQQLGGYSGQPIIIDPDWTIRGWSWFPDSTRALVNEQQRPDSVTPGAPDTPWRISIISFPSREATSPLPPVHQDPAAIAQWSVPVKEYRPMMGRQSTRVLHGTHSGTATVRYRGIFAWGTYSVTYTNYSDDGKTFVNGTEKVRIINPMGNSVWTADLTSSGERTGYLKGKINIGKSNAFSGEVSSEINGVTYSGVPTQTDFPGVSQPQLIISTSGDQILVTATVAEDDQARPVRGAAVTVGSVTVNTDERGCATIPYAAGDVITVSGGGFRSASMQM